MRKFYEIGKYEQFIEFDGRTSVIRKFNCTCPDFIYRCLVKEEEKVRIKRPCKHLIKAITLLKNAYRKSKEGIEADSEIQVRDMWKGKAGKGFSDSQD